MKKLLTGRMYQFLLVASFGALPAEGGSGANVNLVEFNEMCKIYRLTLAAPIRPGLKPNLNIKTEAEVILDEIEKLDVLTSVNGSYELLNSKKEWTELERETTKPPSLTETKYKAWQAAAETSGLDPSKRGWGARYTRPAISSAVKVAHHKIEHLLGEARKLVSEIGKYESDVDDFLLQARKSLCQAAHGNVNFPSDQKEFTCPGVSEQSGVTFASDGHAKGCKGARGADETGISLVNDIVCLCAKAKTAATEDYCGKSFTFGSINFDLVNAPTLGGKLTEECKKEEGKHSLGVPSPESIAKAISTFRALLGKGRYAGSKETTDETAVLGRNAILGFYQVNAGSALTCSGDLDFSSASKGICVDYREKLQAGKEIPWVEKLEQAATKLEAASAAFQHSRHVFSLLKGVDREARMAYLEAVHGGQVSTDSGPAGTSKSGDKQGALTGGPTTAQDEKSSTNSSKALGITSFLQLLLLCGKVLRL